MDNDVARVYGNQVRIRACGICIKGEAILMVNHAGVTDGDFWAPPGGGVVFGDSIEQTMIREFKEETGLDIKTGRFLFGCEYIARPIHSVEIFYEVVHVDGSITTGYDPEIQIIKSVAYLTMPEIKSRKAHEVHGIFRFVNTIDELKLLSGFYCI
ncbi:MAG TPA: NUDIX domain-containing protein [Chryseosolibacter sp.]|nr:NUDIX domain-containing protein [Chryseosolibacter sp.]